MPLIKKKISPHKGTKEILEYFQFNYEKVTNIYDSPIFQYLTIINEDWDLIKIMEYVTDWREFIWSIYENKTAQAIKIKQNNITPEPTKTMQQKREEVKSYLRRKAVDKVVSSRPKPNSKQTNES